MGFGEPQVSALSKSVRLGRFLVILLTTVGIYALALKPKLEEQGFDLRRLNQEVQVIRRDNERLKREKDGLRQQLENRAPVADEANGQPKLRPRQSMPKQHRRLQPTPEDLRLKGLDFDNDDPLDGLE